MAFVADFNILIIGQERVSPRTSSPTSPLIVPFNTDIDNSGHAVFQLMYRGLQRGTAEIFVNDRKATDLLPYEHSSESDWHQFTFVTMPGVLQQRNNRIRFDASAEEPYFVSNVICFVKQDA